MVAGDTSKNSRNDAPACKDSNGSHKLDTHEDIREAHDNEACEASNQASGDGEEGSEKADTSPADVHQASSEIMDSGHPNQLNKHSKR